MRRTLSTLTSIFLVFFNLFADEKPDSISYSPIQEVVVTGSNSAVGKNLIPYTVSVVGEKALEESNSNQLLSSISVMVPSLFVTERGPFGFGVSKGGSGVIKIRGIGGDQGSVLMMVDGQPQFAGIYSHHIADFYGKDYVEKVEVLRGPGSVLYGSNAMGGVINVITKGPSRKGFHATLTSQYGSYNTWLSTLSATARYGRFSAMASASYDRTDGSMKGLLYTQWSGYAKAGYEFSENWKANVDLTLMDFKGQDPVYPRVYDSNPEGLYLQHVIRGETSIGVFNRYANTDGALRVYYSWGNHFIEDPNPFHSLDDRFGVLAYQNISFRSNTDLTVGFDFNTYSGEIPMSGGKPHTPGSLSTMERKRIEEYSPYVTASQSLFERQLIINAGLRMANSNLFGTKWVPQAGVVVSPRHLLTIKLSASNGYRNPSFKELYLYKMASPDLKPENLWNYELSVGKRISRYLEFEVTGFCSEGSNLIQVKDMKNVNTGEFTNFGLEVNVKSQPLERLFLSASYSLLKSSLKDLAGAPVNQYFLGVDWQVLKRLSIGAELKGVDRLFVSESMPLQSYALLDLKVDYNACKWLALFLKLNNVTDARYQIVRGYDMPGFNLMGGIHLKF